MSSHSNIEPRYFSKREQFVFFTGLSLIVFIKLTVLSFGIEKISPIATTLLLIIEIAVFTLILKKTAFDRRFLLQCALVVCYFLVFIYLIANSVNLADILSLIGKALTPNLLLAITSLALGAGIFEEVLFRKILFDFFQKGMSVRWAIFWTSFAFFFIHYSMNPLLFFAGVFYANLVLRFRSLIAVILLHGFYNFIGYLSTIKELQSTYLSDSNSASVWLGGCSAIADIIFWGLFILYIVIMWAWRKITATDGAMLDAGTAANTSSEV